MGALLLASTAWAQGASALVAPSVPGSIAVPAGNVPFLVGHASGAQIYRCQAADSTYAWTLVAPAAVLKDDAGRLIAWHYAGPSWRAVDGSTVMAARIGSATAPIPNAIPWLLLAVTSHPGPAGALTPTTFIQRINTTGGVAPATGCDAAHVGATTSVPYTADYWFYKAG